MWTKKTPEEIDKSYRSKAINISSFLSIAFVVLSGIFVKTGYKKYSAISYNPISWGDFFHVFPYFLPVAIAIFIISFLVLRTMRTNWQRMCVVCKTIFSNDITAKSCECGGEIHFISDLKWVEEKEGKRTN